MAITSITISQNNGDLLSIFNPLVFIADVAWTVAAPTQLFCSISISDADITIFKGNALVYKDLPGVRQFYLIANEMLQSVLTNFEDFAQTSGTVVENNNQKKFVVQFWNGTISTVIFVDNFVFHGLTCSRQISEDPYLSDVKANSYDKLIAYENEPFYLPAWVDASLRYFKFDGVTYTPTDLDLLYRLKVTKAVGNYSVDYFNPAISNVTPQSSLLVEVREACPDGLLIKYLDDVGIYRFWQFSKYYDISESSEEIGYLTNFIPSINLGIPDKTQIGKKVARKYILSSDVNIEDIEHIKGMYTSPITYAKIANVWQIVNFNVLNKQIKLKKGNKFLLNAEITMPDRYTVTK
jgi:hypothetical protein